MKFVTYLSGIALGLFGIAVFHPLLTLIGIGLALSSFLVGKETNG